MERIDSNINWDDVIKKEARGLDDADLGEVQEVNNDTVITQKGIVSKDRYYLPKNLLSRFDGNKLWFNITKDEADRYKNNEASISNEDSISNDSNNLVDKSTSNKDQSAEYTTRGYLNRDDRYEARKDAPEDISDITDKSITHRGTYRDMVNDSNLPRNTITTDDNYNNRDIDDSAIKDPLHDGRNINDLNAKGGTDTSTSLDNNIDTTDTTPTSTSLDNNIDTTDTTPTSTSLDNNIGTSGTSTSNNIDSNINWDDVIKKEARGLDDADLGEVQEVNNDNVITQKGIVSKDRYYLPKNLIIRFDDNKLWFNITKDEADRYKKD